MNDTGAHPDFQATGFSEQELQVVSENGLLSDIIRKVPDYSPSDLSTQTYKLYTKSYAPWTCNTLYPTTSVATQAEEIDHVSKDSSATFIITLV